MQKKDKKLENYSNWLNFDKMGHTLGYKRPAENVLKTLSRVFDVLIIILGDNQINTVHLNLGLSTLHRMVK